MRELAFDEIESVNGGFLANVGMGMAGMTGGVGLYALGGGISGQLSGSGIANAAVSGFIFGFSGFNPAAAIAGAAVGGAVQGALDKEDS